MKNSPGNPSNFKGNIIEFLLNFCRISTPKMVQHLALVQYPNGILEVMPVMARRLSGSRAPSLGVAPSCWSVACARDSSKRDVSPGRKPAIGKEASMLRSCQIALHWLCSHHDPIKFDFSYILPSIPYNFLYISHIFPICLMYFLLFSLIRY